MTSTSTRIKFITNVPTESCYLRAPRTQPGRHQVTGDAVPPRLTTGPSATWMLIVVWKPPSAAIWMLIALRERPRTASMSLHTIIRLGREGFLEPEHSAAFRSLIEQFAAPHPACDGIPDARTTPERNANALLEVCGLARAAQDCPTTAGEPPHLTLTIDWDALRTSAPASGSRPRR